MLINVLYSSTCPKGHTHSPASYSQTVWSKAAGEILSSNLSSRAVKLKTQAQVDMTEESIQRKHNEMFR